MNACSLTGRKVLVSRKRERAFDRTRTVKQLVYVSKTGEVRLELVEEENVFFLVEVIDDMDKMRAARAELKFADVNGEVSFVHLAD